ncbi:Mu transposase C-terminal domain-containing protein [Pseudomonas cichorii]|nr:Mu transposase C-terminal domain-containing protein [Pseudomonas cichorii]
MVRVRAQGVMFKNRLYYSSALIPLRGECVQVDFDPSAPDYPGVIRGESRIKVKLSPYDRAEKMNHDLGSEFVVVKTSPERQEQ